MFINFQENLIETLSKDNGNNDVAKVTDSTTTATATKYITPWSLGSYNEIAVHLLPVSAHLVRLCNISSADHVLDVACGTGNTAITAKRMTGAKRVTCIDIIPEMLVQAREQASIAEVNDIEWKEANLENLPFEDEKFDVVLSSFGHMFAAHPQVAIKEMLRVTKPGGSIAFSTWPAELVNGKLFDIIAKYIASSSSSPSQWGIPQIIEKRLLESSFKVKDIHFERGVINKPVQSPNHSWMTSITKGGTMIHAIQTIKDPKKIEELRQNVLKTITPYINDNVLRLDYLITKATKI
jgi:ubiquinone/menaquinone biosynthesis C-methylase UbiE